MKSDEEESERHKKKKYSLDPWQECVARISNFPNLRKVTLKFHPDVGNPKWYEVAVCHPPEDVELRTSVLITLFMALDRKQLNVDTLSMEHLQHFTSDVYTLRLSKMSGTSSRVYT
jgi:hypothetical protein